VVLKFPLIPVQIALSNIPHTLLAMTASRNTDVTLENLVKFLVACGIAIGVAASVNALIRLFDAETAKVVPGGGYVLAGLTYKQLTIQFGNLAIQYFVDGERALEHIRLQAVFWITLPGIQSKTTIVTIAKSHTYLKILNSSSNHFSCFVANFP